MTLATLENLAHKSLIETDVCIVGGGPAGISIALALDAANIRTFIVEGGGRQANEAYQSLYETFSLGLPYSGKNSRLRQLGGSSNCWSGWCRPLEPIDFEPHPQPPLSGWPISYKEYARFLPKAQSLCELGDLDYSLETWRPRLQAPFRNSPKIQSPALRDGVWQHSAPTRFGERYAGQLQKSKNCTVALHANAYSAEFSDRRLRSIKVRNLGGNSLTIKARHFVLACGGIENARLMLSWNEKGGAAPGNEFDQIGRHFTDHMIFHSALDVYPIGNHLFQYVDMLPTTRPPPGFLTPWLALDADRQQKLKLSNTSWRLQRPRSLINAGANTEAVWRALGEAHSNPGSLLPHISKMSVVAISDILPNPDSRLTLSPIKDALGVPIANIDWRISGRDIDSMRTTLNQFALEALRLGIARSSPVSIPSLAKLTDTDFWRGNHHYGTTRMASDPRHGVVDKDCRVHSLSNLFIAGSSIFPKPGAATPTLSIVTLALRLADHLRSKMISD